MDKQTKDYRIRELANVTFEQSLSGEFQATLKLASGNGYGKTKTFNITEKELQAIVYLLTH